MTTQSQLIIYYKSADTHQYLNFKPCHATHIKTQDSVLSSQANLYYSRWSKYQGHTTYRIQKISAKVKFPSPTYRK